MRAEGDHRQYFVVKSQILDGILADGNEIVPPPVIRVI